MNRNGNEDDTLCLARLANASQHCQLQRGSLLVMMVMPSWVCVTARPGPVLGQASNHQGWLGASWCLDCRASESGKAGGHASPAASAQRLARPAAEWMLVCTQSSWFTS